MITGAHILLFSADADADRAFLRDVLEFRAIDAGHGWPIFGLPPAEMAVHPAEIDAAASGSEFDASLYLMCADVRAFMASMAARNIECSPRAQERWGLRTAIRLPSGGQLGVYQPLHPTAI
jgi:catechol 2,3-dioxygenase-like lactoylglutathione lyase family enzyme